MVHIPIVISPLLLQTYLQSLSLNYMNILKVNPHLICRLTHALRLIVTCRFILILESTMFMALCQLKRSATSSPTAPLKQDSRKPYTHNSTQNCIKDDTNVSVCCMMPRCSYTQNQRYCYASNCSIDCNSSTIHWHRQTRYYIHTWA